MRDVLPRLVLMAVLWGGAWFLIDDWRIFVAVFAITWAHNVEYHWRQRP